MEQSCFTRTDITVTALDDDDALRGKAKVLAEELGLPFVNGIASDVDRKGAVRNVQIKGASAKGRGRGAPGSGYDLLLLVRGDRLELRDMSAGRRGSLSVDFLAGPVGYRRKSGLSRRQPIAKAVGVGRGVSKVIDATAGLGRDSFLLACLGCTVVAIERSPIIAALVRDGLARAVRRGTPEVRAAVDRITLIVDDARGVLCNMASESAPEVVYIDPMYPPRKKTALPKKEMAICRRLVGEDPDAAELLEIARRVATRRVVVKRPPHGPQLAPRPAISYTGKQVRYDVYHPCA